MRWKFPALAVFIAVMSIIAVPVKSEAQTVNIDLFYQELSPHGQWYPHPEFGNVWQPYDVGPDWKPYIDGRWAWSDQGWIWISYEPWGWATYHYGRWIYDDYQGWIWIPGTTWAPAWVSWHQTPDYIGWSPLPPDRGFFIEIGFVFNSYKPHYYKPHRYKHHHRKHYKRHRYYHDYYHNPHNYRPPARHCVFLPYDDFGHHKQRLKAVELGPGHDIVLRNSKNVTNIKYVNNKVINYGPDKHLIEKHSKQKLVRHNIVDKDTITFKKNNNVNVVKGNNYNVYRPKIQRSNRNPNITNRNQLQNGNPRKNQDYSKVNRENKRKEPSQNLDLKHRSQEKRGISRKQTTTRLYENNNYRGPSERKDIKTHPTSNSQDINKRDYNRNSSEYKKYDYKNKQQTKSHRKEPSQGKKTHSVQKKKVSLQKQNINRSNNYNKQQFKQKSRTTYKSNKKSGVKNYSKKQKNVSRNTRPAVQGNSYNSKIKSAPISRKPALSKR